MADEQRRVYRVCLKERLAYGVDPDRSERLRDVIAIGSSAFARRIRQSIDPETEMTNRRDLRKRVSEKHVRDAVVAVRAEPWRAFYQRRGDWGRLLYLWAMRHYTGCTLRDAGQHTGAMKPSTVDMAVKRWRRLVADEPGMRARQGELIQRLGESNWKLEG